LQWNDAALAAIRTTSTAPPAASRHLAMLHVAVFDAVNGIRPKFAYYVTPPAAHNNSNRAAALSVAAHDVLAAVQPSQIRRLPSTWRRRTSSPS
jgi:hypothetical protein